MTPDELKGRRKALGFGPVDFAKEIGVCYQTLWRWEAGKRAIPEMLEKLLHCLEVTKWAADRLDEKHGQPF